MQCGRCWDATTNILWLYLSRWILNKFFYLWNNVHRSSITIRLRTCIMFVISCWLQSGPINTATEREPGGCSPQENFPDQNRIIWKAETQRRWENVRDTPHAQMFWEHRVPVLVCIPRPCLLPVRVAVVGTETTLWGLGSVNEAWKAGMKGTFFGLRPAEGQRMKGVLKGRTAWAE